MPRALLRFVAFVAPFLLSIAAQAQRVPTSSLSIQVSGQVRYAQGYRPAEFVLVRLESFGGGIAGETNTDRNGKFGFTGLRPELYVVSVRVQGFREAKQEVDLRTQRTDYVLLQLVADDRNSSSSPSKPAVINAKVPNNAVAEFQKGRDALLHNNNREGILHLENAVKIYPKYMEALLLLGTAYMDNRDWAKAESTLRQALVIEPKLAAAHFALGELHLRQKKYSESEKEALAGIKLDPKSVGGHFLLGRLYYELGDIIKAGPQIGTALQLNPKLAEGHLLAANILLRANQVENALVEFEEYLRLEPNGKYSEQAKEAAQKIKESLAKP
ncbi:MAG: tetratricopeptide repeat protein [Acidobacteriota bacterium]|nr:tetratricopeptide repeat protein [Acidobacteriota bacterium]